MSSQQLDVEGRTSLQSSLVETTLLISKAREEATDTGYAATGVSGATAFQQKKIPRSFDPDASNTPGTSVPGTPRPDTNSRTQETQIQPPPENTIPPKREPLLVTVRNKTSLRLENSGSVARDHLASERTFLAYIRTSLAIASSGVALVQLFSVSARSTSPGNLLAPNAMLQGFVRPLGAITIFIGLSVLLIGVTRYFLVQSALTKGYFPAARSAMAFISLSLAALIGATFTFLVLGKVGPGGH
ncbi:hypothetical protein DFP72DRAFT_239057 [Ephemerocybe angulata]|uniref:DUF202 domain-containing protein n=1 Tax=Ephemerocybe angulata TaxID=980116 RepID=A0A8H6I2M7_9AGAR|nr:hypothetical protein DFP72DRAFT_239057 [Tulosesus angulatus]